MSVVRQTKKSVLAERRRAMIAICEKGWRPASPASERKRLIRYTEALRVTSNGYCGVHSTSGSKCPTTKE